MIDILVIALISSGILFIILAGLGILRMPDFYMRLSVTTKAMTLGVGLILIAAAVAFNEFAITARVIAIIVFLILTAPVGAHMIGRASYFTGVKLWENSVCDDLKGQYNRKTHTLGSQEEAAATQSSETPES